MGQGEDDRFRWEGTVAKSIDTLERDLANVEEKAASHGDVERVEQIATDAVSRVVQMRSALLTAIKDSGKETRKHLDTRLSDLGVKDFGDRLTKTEGAIEKVTGRVDVLARLSVGMVLKYAGFGGGGAVVLGLIVWLVKWAVTGDPAIK